MNIGELQENFEAACFYYAISKSPVKSSDDLFEANYVKNEDKKPGTPNYYKRITKWNHDSKVPNDDDLMKFSVKEVVGRYKISKPDFLFLQTRLLKCSNKFRESFDKSCLKDGDMIFNEESSRLEIFIDGSLYELSSRRSS